MKFKKIKIKKIFKIQLIISIIGAVVLGTYYVYNFFEESKKENLSNIPSRTLQLSSIYDAKKQIREERIYLGTIKIPKIELEYVVYNNFTEELLKIAPCRFYGVGLGEKGNICITGHNYNDNRFFGRIDELKNKDEIILIDLENNEYRYIVYDIYETEETDFGPLKSKKEYELTLITCNNLNKKRLIIKAVRNK